MAQGTKAAAAPTAPSNGVAGTHAPQPASVNRKKQKRREKEAAKRAADAQKQPAVPVRNGIPPPQQQPAHHHHAAAAHQQAPQYADADYEPDFDDGTPHDEEGDFYSGEEENGYYDEHGYRIHGHPETSYVPRPTSDQNGRKAKEKKTLPPPQSAYHNPPPRHMGNARKPNAGKNNRIWNTTTQEERERIREFWLSLGEDERKSLVKIEKEAVLRKMKEQQKHSCSCTVCGRKRTAIEEELEVLYDAYYEELEHTPRPIMATHPPPGHYDNDEYSGDEEDGDQDYSNSEISSEEDYSEEERSLPPPETADFLRFGNSLQVKGGILTVADDLLKNDGKKFIEMMEQLAERRMQREEEAQYQAHPSMYRGPPTSHHQQPEEDEFDEEEEDEEGYEDEDYEEDEDEEDTMTEEQRMEEGRRMFQIFAARMFEQRVLQAYREKVAKERQEQLLQELYEEGQQQELRDAKKAKEAAKKKEKKEKQKQLKLEEKARKEAELATKEAELKAAEEKRLEEQRKKREEQRKKKESERKAQEEEKQRKEAERLRRQQEERERQQEAERKAREHKLHEKKAREEAKRKEREEREAREKEAKEKKAQEEKDRREREAKARAEKERVRKEEQAVAAAAAAQNTPAPAKKNSQPVAVALPPQLLKQTSSTGFPSPHVTPAVPKAPTPSRPRQSSQQGSHGSSPKPSSKSMSPASQAQIPIVPKSILTKPTTSQQLNPAPATQPTSSMPPIGPPPGMPIPPGMGIGTMPPGLNGFPGQGSTMAGMMGPGRSMPMFPPQPVGQTFRGFPPPGMHAPTPMQMGRGFPMDGPPPGFGPMQGFPAPNHPPGFGMGMPSHSRQTSGSFDKQNSDSPIAPPGAHPIQRPAPIQRPSSVKPHDNGTGHSDVDELADHLGSKALLDDEEDLNLDDFNPTARRRSTQPHGSLRGAPLGFGFGEVPGPPRPDIPGPFAGSSNASVWGTPPMGGMPFPMPGSGWGTSPTANLFSNPFPMMPAQRPNEQRGPGEQRLVWLRRIVCQTCKMLSMRQAGADGYVDAQEVHSHIESARAPTEPTVGIQEIKEACDIIGDNNNGGGSLEYKESPSGRLSQIKFVDAGSIPPPTLGEIGSPIPSHSVPVGGGFGAGRPFPGLGPQAF